MEFDQATVNHLQVPLQGVYSSAHHPDLDTIDSILVTISDHDGVRGIGTADTVSGYSVHTHEEVKRASVELLRHVLTEQPDNYNQFRALCERFPAESNARCAVEMAFLDLYTRRTGVTIGEFLGGTLADSQSLNAWVGFDDPDVMADEARDWVDRGFDSLKIKLNGDRDTDVERIRTVCEAIGDDAGVRADANCAYRDVDAAIEVAHAVEEYSLSHLEQPIPKDDVRGLKRLTESTSVPIMADECLTDVTRVRQVLEEAAADRLKLKILRLGGIDATRTALDLAEVHGVQCVIGHGFCLSPAASAEIQLTLSHGNVYTPVETVGPLKTIDEPFEPCLDMRHGRVTVPDEPGIGLELDDGSLEEYLQSREIVE